jgi:hypothetical protein
MLRLPTATLEKMGRDAAEAVGGPGVVGAILVQPGVDAFERPAYHFRFLINQDRSNLGPGLLRIRLRLRLLDDLIELGDEHEVVLEMLDRADWDQRAASQSY